MVRLKIRFRWRIGNSEGVPLIHTYRKYQPFLRMSELPVRRCGTVGSNTAWFK